MRLQVAIQWLAEGCELVAMPSPKGARNVFLMNRGLVVAVLRMPEADYQELMARGAVFAYEQKPESSKASQPATETSATSNGAAGRQRRIWAPPESD